jgi:hypothetical protein
MKIDPEEQKLVNDEKKININTEVINPINNQNEEIKIKEKPKIRNSSFELLRIILMILIILSHIIF